MIFGKLKNFSLKNIFKLLLLALFFLPITADLAISTAESAPELAFKRVVLANGIQVVVHQTPKSNLGFIQCLFRGGEGTQLFRNPEVFHLIEHLFFSTPGENSKTYMSALLGSLGKGHLFKGYTGWSFTRYENQVPAEYLEWAISLEGWRFTRLSNFFSRRIDLEKQVLEAERQENQHSNDVLKELVAFFNRFSRVSDLELDVDLFSNPSGVLLQEVNDVLHKSFSGANLTIAISGPDDPDVIISWVKSAFADLPAGTSVKSTSESFSGAGIGPIQLFSTKYTHRILLGWQAPNRFTQDYPAFRLFFWILSSRFYKDARLLELTHERSWLDPNEDSWPLIFTAKLASETSATEFVERFTGIIDSIVASGPTIAEMQGALENRKKTLWQEFEAPDTRLQLLALGSFFADDPGAWREELKHYTSVTASDVVEFARLAISREKAICLLFTASDSHSIARKRMDNTLQLVSSSPDVLASDAVPLVAEAERPTNSPVFTEIFPAPTKPPTIQCHRLGSGMQVWVMNNPFTPLVRAKLLARGGAKNDLPGKEGTACLALECMAASLASDSNGLKSSFEWKADDDQSIVSWEANPGVFIQTLDSLMILLASPAFKIDAFATVKKQAIPNQDKFLSKLLRFSVFGASCRYSKSSQGTASSVAQIEVSDLDSFWGSSIQPDKTALFLQIPPGFQAQIPGVLEVAGKWIGNEVITTRSSELPQPLEPGSVVFMDVPVASQVKFLQVWPGFPAESREAHIQQVFFEDFSEFLFLSLREQGMLYSLTSSHIQWELMECGIIRGAVPSAQTKEVLRHFQSAMREYFQKPDWQALLLRKAEYSAAFFLRSTIEHHSWFPMVNAWKKRITPDELFAYYQWRDGEAMKKLLPDPAKPFSCFFILTGQADVIRDAAQVLPPGLRFLATGTSDIVLQPLLK